MRSKTFRILFYLIGFVAGLYVHLPLMTVFLLEEGVQASLIVFAGLFYSLGQLLFEVPTGYLADRYGQKQSMVAGFIFEGLGLFVIVLWPTAIGLSISYFIGGIAAAFLSGSQEALCYENTKAAGGNHVRVFGGYWSANTIGMVIASALGGTAFTLFGLSAAPWLFASTGLALFVAALFTMFLKNAQSSRVGKEKGSRYLETVKEGFAFIRQEDLLRTTLIVSMFILSGEWVLYNIYQPLFEDANVPAVWFGLVLSFGMIINAIVTANVHRFERRLKLEQILVGVSLLVGVCYLLFATIAHPVVAILSVILILGFAEVYRPVLSDYLNERIPSDQRSTILSTISFSQRFAAMGMRLLLTLAVLFGGFVASVYVQGVYLFLGAIVTYWLLKRCGCTHRIKTSSPVLIEEVR